MAHRRTRRVAKPGEDIHDQPTVVEPDEYELEEPSPSPRRSGRGRAQHQEAHNDDQDVPAKSGNFKVRWFSAMLGFLGAWMVFISVQWEILEPSWQALFEASGNPAWQHYVLFGLGAFFGSFGVCLFIALIDKSAFRNFISGAAWFAFVATILNVLFILQPQPPVNVKESVPAASEMIRMSLMPSIAAFEREHNALQMELEQSKQQLGEIQEKNKVQIATNEGLLASLEASKKETSQAQTDTEAAQKKQAAHKATIVELTEDVAALKLSLEAKDQEIKQAQGKAEDMEVRAGASEKALLAAVERNKKDNAEIERLTKALKDAKQALQRAKDMAAMEKMGNNPTPLEKAPGLGSD